MSSVVSHTGCRYLCRLCGKYVNVEEVVDVTSYLKDVQKRSAILQCLQDVETENHVRLYFHVLPPLDNSIIMNYARFCQVCVSRAQTIFEARGYGTLSNVPAGVYISVKEDSNVDKKEDIDPFIMELEP